MNAQEFLKTKGESVAPQVRFVTAGVVRMIPLVDLLAEYAALVGAGSAVQDAIVDLKVATPEPKGGKTTKTNKSK